MCRIRSWNLWNLNFERSTTPNSSKSIVERLREPQLSLEVKAGQISEDVTRLVESLGYRITAKREMEGWNRLQAVKQDK
jgi:hypothetical protein